jgi:hypothetical protein
MKKIVKLTERDLTRIVKRIIFEENEIENKETEQASGGIGIIKSELEMIAGQTKNAIDQIKDMKETSEFDYKSYLETLATFANTKLKEIQNK